jgi:hypothetical protein
MDDERAGAPLASAAYPPGMSFLDSLRRKLHLRSFERNDYRLEGDRTVENLDAGATAAAREASVDISGAAPGYPPGYVKDYDDGRPRH